MCVDFLKKNTEGKNFKTFHRNIQRPKTRVYITADN